LSWEKDVAFRVLAAQARPITLPAIARFVGRHQEAIAEAQAVDAAETRLTGYARRRAPP
jgi:hypothetical protein